MTSFAEQGETVRVREFRLARGWSQAQLAELSGLSVRTVQRIESGANPGLESMKNLAHVLGIDVADLQPQPGEGGRRSPLFDAVSESLRRYDDFTGATGRAEFWWFTLAVVLAIALGTAIGPWLGTAVGVVLLLPWLAAATRRLRDAGQSLWWLVVFFAPVGGLVVMAVMLSLPSEGAPESIESPTPAPGRS